MRMFKRTLSLVLSCILLISTYCSCGNSSAKIEPLKVEKVDTYSFDFIGGKDVMPIVGYHGPQTYQYSAKGQSIPDYFSDDFMKMVADSGVNVIVATGVDYTTKTKYVKRLLELGNKYGVGIFVHDTAVNASLDDETLSVSELDQQINQYVSNPACCGLYIIDEPANKEYYPEYEYKYISRYGKLMKNLSDLNVFTYCNMFPATSTSVADKYRRYLNEFLDTCPVKVLSYDKYPFVSDNSLKYADEWIFNLSEIRKAAEAHNIPFWSFIQAGSQWNDAQAHFDTQGYFPEEGSFDWLVNTSLAFGAKGIQYFPLLQPYWFAYSSTEPYDFERNGLIGAWGNKNRWYYYAQEINKQIRAVDQVLMNSKNKGIIVTDDKSKEHFANCEYMLKGNKWRELESASGNLMIGCFNYQGHSAFYVVNYDNESAQKTALKFSGKYKMEVTQGAKTKSFNTDELELTLCAGEGVLIVMK